jgi:hypothetical protein
MPTPEPTPTTITIIGWNDPTGGALGFAPDSPYVEACYLPRLGPTGFVTYRYLTGLLRGRDQTIVDLVETAGNLGLRPGVGRSAPLVMTLAHLEAFGLATWQADGRYALRLTAPPLTDRQARRLPDRARRMHDAVLARHRWNGR